MISRFYFSLFLSLLPPGIAQAADTFPARPVRIVVPTGAGGVTDVVARVVAQKLGELFRAMAGLRVTQVFYKGAPQVATALVGGEIQVYFAASMAAVFPHLKSGRVRVLGVATRERLPFLPDVPPIADTVPGYEVQGWNGILAPAGTPRAIVDQLNRDIVRIVKTPQFAEQFAPEGIVPVGNTPDQFTQVMIADIAKWAKVIKSAGIRGEQ